MELLSEMHNHHSFLSFDHSKGCVGLDFNTCISELSGVVPEFRNLRHSWNSLMPFVRHFSKGYRVTGHSTSSI